MTSGIGAAAKSSQLSSDPRLDAAAVQAVFHLLYPEAFMNYSF